MTVDEVTAVHVAVEEEVASSSSKVEIPVEEDQVRKNEKKDVSNGVNGKTVREDTDGDGDYVFVNGNDSENGDPVASDPEKIGNGVGGGDQGVESLGSGGEVKSKSDLVKDLDVGDESCVGIVDQDNESMQLRHVEASVDEQKSGDLVESGPVSAINAENGVSETSMADQNVVSESPANDSVEDNVLYFRSKEDESTEMAAADDDNAEANSRSKENEGSEMTAADDVSAKPAVSETPMTVENGVSESPANDIVEDNILDFKSKENEGSEMTVADDDDCNGDGLANDSAKATVLQTSMIDQNGVSDLRSNDNIEDNALDFRSMRNEGSEMVVADDGDCNGDGFANDSAKTFVSETSMQNGVSESPVNDSIEDNVLDFRSKESEGFEMAAADDGDCNGDGLDNDSAKTTVSEANVIDSRSIENEVSGIAVADNGDCDSDGLANDSTKATVSGISVADHNGVFESSANDSVGDNILDFRSKENEGSEMAAVDDGDCNGNDLAVDSAEVIASEANDFKSRSNENEGSEMAVADDVKCNGDGSAIVTAKATVSEASVLDFRSKEGVDSEMAVADDNNGDGLANGSAKFTVSEAAVDTKNEQYEVSELPLTHDGATTISVSDGDGDPLPNLSEKNTVSEAVLVDSGADQNESSNGVEVEAEADHPGLVSNGNGDKLEQNTLSEIPEDVSGNESVKSGDSSTAADEFPVESGTELERSLDKETGNISFSNECGEALLDVHTQDGISETVQINPSTDSSLKSQQDQSSELVENSLSKNVPSADVVEGSSSTVTLDNIVSVETDVSDATAETFPSSSVDEKLETEFIKSDENGRVGLGSHHVDNLEIDVKVESGSVDDNSKSRCAAEGDDSIVSEEAEFSKVLSHSTETDENSVAVVDIQSDSNLVDTACDDEKAPTEVEKSSADISEKEGLVHESRVSDCDTNNDEQSCAVVKGGIQFGSVGTSQELEGLDEVEKKSPFYFLIKIPRYDDENLKEKIRLAQIRVDEKTQSRDAIRAEIQRERAGCKKYADAVDAAISQERAIRDLHRSKRQEMDSIQSMMNIEDIDAQIRNMEHMIQHETMPLKDEKQYIHQIKQYKQTRERMISSNMGRQDEVKQGLDQKDQIKERMKSLKKEADQLKINLLKAEAVTKAAKKEYHDESDKLNKLLSQFKAADDIRQEAYVQLLSLKKQSYEKNKDFYQYRDDAKAANDLALKGDKEALQNLCLNQVEKVMDLWNNNDEFRKEYIRCNVRSTVRRLRTLDGRALGPDEDPPVIPRVVIERVAKDQSVSSSTVEEQTKVPAKAETVKEKPVVKSLVQKNQTSKSENPLKSVPPASGSTTASSRDKIEETEEEKPKITKEEEEMARKAEEMTRKEEEMARKAEELRKEEEAAKLREQRRLEEIAKAKEALERKRRNAEKAQARAALRAQKEAEEKEKEREKRAKKKERRKGAVAGDASVADETESAPTLETPAETPKDSQIKEKPVTVTKRSQKPSQFTKQTKVKSVPPPLRIRGKRKMQPWMWVLLTCLVILALFLIGNYNISFNLGLLQKFNF